MTNGLTDEAIAAYAAQLLDLEADIEALQDDKKDVYANLREAYGKKAADSLKLAIKRHRMDADKREAADEIDAEAERFLTVIRAPRATHAIANPVPDHNPETGEIIEPTGNDAGGAEDEAVANDAEPSAQPIPEPLIVDPSDPQWSGAAEGNEAGLAAQETIATADAPPLAGANDDRGGKVTPPTAPAPVITIRTHNPDTHFLSEKGLHRLHGCLKPELCGSTQPRVKLCFDCSRLHDGPPAQNGAAA